ncbi:MAG: carboxypeptidase-like regulatory domain-containing protein [Eudoraea sp.]|nr:carboxypeptidase-like regulatory domain-containing protein [Eudoraea sp.]MBT8293399.1 carboxypeptidase-like regulatory domain-containing protein [Eudoraea sp.]NNL02183.1 carboxypeptidase-like regulatory domain-containing protein [Eudoraea sp.]
MKKLTLIFSLLFTGLLFSQQQGSVVGTILDKEMNNEPLLFANVQLKNTSKSIQTNFHGNFEIHDIKAGDYTLVVSYLGYETLEIPISIEEKKTTQVLSELESKKISLEDIASLQRSSEKDVDITATVDQSSRK